MYDEVRLDIQPSRYGYIVAPYLQQLKFDYNHVYGSIEDVIQDFRFNGFACKGKTEDGYYIFERMSKL